MRKSFKILIIGFASTTTLCGCGGEAIDTTTINKQTILAFMPWTGGTSDSETGLTSDLQANIDSIDAAIVKNKGLTNSRVLVFFSNAPTQANLYELVYNETTKSVDHVILNTYSDNSYTTSDGFANILKEVQTNAPALNYALIIGAHGCGWTFKDSWSDYPRKSISSGKDAPSFSFGTDPNNPVTRFFGSVTSRDNMMDVTDLAEGIKNSGISKLQYILFDACYMGNVETAYELKGVTNFMLASSSEILSTGIPYYSLWSYLNSATPNYASVVSGFYNFYNSSSSPYGNFAAIDCRQMDKLAEVMKNINDQYKLSETVNLDSIQRLDGFDMLSGNKKHLFYDLETYVDSLHPSGYLKSQFTTQLQATVTAAQSTGSVISVLPGRTEIIPVKHYSGLSISDPSIHSVALSSKEKTGWWKATH